MRSTRRCDNGAAVDADFAGIFPCASVRCVLNLSSPPGTFVSGCFRYANKATGEASTMVGEVCDVACKRSMSSPATELRDSVALEKRAANIQARV